MTDQSEPKQSIALHIGVNWVDAKLYGGWDGLLEACENDARDMAAITKSLDYDQTVLLTADATVANLVGGVERAAALTWDNDDRAGSLRFLKCDRGSSTDRKVDDLRELISPRTETAQPS